MWSSLALGVAILACSLALEVRVSLALEAGRAGHSLRVKGNSDKYFDSLKEQDEPKSPDYKKDNVLDDADKNADANMKGTSKGTERPNYKKDNALDDADDNADRGMRDAKEADPQGQRYKKDNAATVDPDAKTQKNVKDSKMDSNKKLENDQATSPPTSLRCIICIIIQYMIIYTALAVVRTYNEAAGQTRGLWEAAFRGAAQTLALGPMLCVLFVACRMRVQFLSQGKDEPQDWVQWCMVGCTASLMLSTFVALAIPLSTGKLPKVDEKTGDLHKDFTTVLEHESSLLALTGLRFMILFLMYGGVAGVIVGMCTYEPPKATSVNDKIPPPAVAIACAMYMATLFFLVYLAIALGRSYTELTGHSSKKFEMVMTGATRTVEFAPMLCILFLAARMRALQMDPVNGAPQRWAQNLFLAITLALVAQTFLAIAVPLSQSEEEIEHDDNGNPLVQDDQLSVVLTICRCIIMSCIYIGFTCVILSIFLIEHPAGPEYTPPLSPTVRCVVILTLQYFLVYLMLWILLSVQQLTGVEVEELRFYSALEAARTTVAFCPMLAILFVATRMHALQLSNNQGAPQAWAQDGMYQSTWSVMISFLVCLVTGCFMVVKSDMNGNVINEFSNKPVGIMLASIRYICILLLYSGIVIVIVSIFVITPRTATGRGALPGYSDIVDMTPMGHPPPAPPTSS